MLKIHLHHFIRYGIIPNCQWIEINFSYITIRTTKHRLCFSICMYYFSSNSILFFFSLKKNHKIWVLTHLLKTMDRCMIYCCSHNFFYCLCVSLSSSMLILLLWFSNKIQKQVLWDVQYSHFAQDCFGSNYRSQY